MVASFHRGKRELLGIKEALKAVVHGNCKLKAESQHETQPIFIFLQGFKIKLNEFR